MKHFLLLLFPLLAGQLAAANTTELRESMLTLSLGNQQLVYDNRVDVDFDASQNPVMIYAFQNDGTYIQALDSYWNPAANAIALKGLYFMDFLIVDGNYYVLAEEHAGYSGDGTLDYEKQGNVVVFLKLNPQGKLIYKKNLFGDGGVKGGSFFLCTYSSTGQLAFDGTYFHAFVETCGNFSAQGSSEFDIHQGDYYLTFTQDGIIRENGESIWNHSHSNLLQLITGNPGEAYTLEVSDGGPWGINFDHFSNGKRVASTTVFPSATTLPYDDMYSVATSTNDAGDIGGLVQFGNYFYTVIASVPGNQHPIADQHKDLLLAQFNDDGERIAQTWIRQTPDLDESLPFILPYGDAIFMIYMKRAGKFNYDYLATFALLNTQGNYLIEPTSTKYHFDYQSRLIHFPNGDIGLISAKGGSSTVDIIRFGTGQLPNFNNPQDAAHMQPVHFSGTTVQHLAPAYAEGEIRDTEKINQFNQNMNFNGIYTSVNPVDPEKGVYVDGKYSDVPGFAVTMNEIDLSNFSVEVEFMVEAFRNAPVFSISRSYRILECFMNDEGYLYLSLNNGDIVVQSTAKYSLNTWHKAKITLIGSTITLYLDGVLAISKNASIDPGVEVHDISTTNFSRGLAFKGYIRSFSAGKAH